MCSIMDPDLSCKSNISIVLSLKGIPDFRSPNFGLYFTMAKKFRLTNPMNLFQIDYYRKNPEPFLYLAREMLKMDVKPTVSHYFQHLLDQKGLLLR